MAQHAAHTLADAIERAATVREPLTRSRTSIPALATLRVTIRASEIFFLARVIRAAMVGSDTRKARATSGV
jgi:hypothetical protein